jgi:hypothetical protein
MVLGKLREMRANAATRLMRFATGNATASNRGASRLPAMTTRTICTTTTAAVARATAL